MDFVVVMQTTISIDEIAHFRRSISMLVIRTANGDDDAKILTQHNCAMAMETEGKVLILMLLTVACSG